MALFTRVCTSKHSLNGLFNRLCKVSKYNNIQVAHINGRMNRDPRPRPPPFPYREKEYTLFRSLIDYNIERFDENSRLVVVEGPIAAGKDKFAKELAKELDMAYMPAPTFDRICIDAYGFDVRTVDHAWPEQLQICDTQRFLTNPKHVNVPAFEGLCYMLRVEAYLESLLHVLSTGEGVVINRCPFSNFVFMKAMCNAGIITQQHRRFLEKVEMQVSTYVMRPHLVIYLDVPVNVVEDRIKKRCIPYEVNSKVLTKQYLTDIETIYKEEYLPQIEEHAFLLMYDWDSSRDISDVVEDIERINIEYDRQDPDKLQDWIFASISDLHNRRIMYSHEERHIIMQESLVTDFEVTDMFLFADDFKKQEELYAKHKPKYEIGYNADKGDKGTLWKTKVEDNILFPRVITNKELLTTE